MSKDKTLGESNFCDITDDHDSSYVENDNLAGPEPTAEEWKELPEVSDDIPKSAFLVILIEFCERFTYYGLTGPFQNYIQYPSPPSYPAAQPGAINKGQQTATALTTFFQFWCYITPIFGAIVADQFWGKYKTILVFSFVYIIGLIILTLTSIPPAIASGAAFPGFIVSLIIIGLGTGGIKSNVSPLVAEQYRSKSAYVKTLPNGKRVIVTPQATYQKIFNYFYWGINVGSLSAIATTELEKNVGFWPAYLLPTLMFIPCVCVVLLGRKYYIQNPPRGSVFVEAGKLLMLRFKVKGGFEACKPSNLIRDHPELAPKATYDDVFVDELKRTLKACVVFCWFPIYWLCYSQMTNNLVSMAGTMLTGNVPNDIMQNIDPIALIIIIPLMDRFIYPGLRRIGIPMKPIARISCGFLFAAAAMGYTAGIQAMVYRTAPYYDNPNGKQNWISAAYLIPSYVLIAISEIFASITGMEYAYKKAPQSMKSIVMALFLLTNCFASILAFALVSVAVDPKLTWMYTGISAAMGACSVLFYICHHKNDDNDAEEDAIGRDADFRQNNTVSDEEAVVTYEAEKNL
ncbi:POT family-domain-containing protein [Gilbertella persicaria]|uniref:Peptide transporter ptr2 n=1 Tax=Rhizopus stolonifer TaxID=4846 RepID=A0A367KX36_RHIST|nr:POT family-domain-containing protein [Gilbertella persicaria]KAI8085799.1 POT family-domain-containing protein [Gilbertella persicaria]RCI06773.1 peptide transporter ptr2 [Rhizopus stolonifer]